MLYRIQVHKDRHAFERLHGMHAAGVLRYLRSKLPSREDADDALSTTFMRVWNYLQNTKVESASGIIYTVARSAVAEFYRARRTSVSLDADDGTEDRLASDRGVSTRRLEAQTELALVRAALAEFSDEEQLAFSLRYFEGLSARDVAERIEKTENATNVLLHRLRKRLQKKFE